MFSETESGSSRGDGALPYTSIRNQNEIREIWSRSMDAFLNDPKNKHLSMKISFGPVIGGVREWDARRPVERAARLEISFLQVEGDKPPEPITKEKKEKPKRRRRKQQDSRKKDSTSLSSSVSLKETKKRGSGGSAGRASGTDSSFNFESQQTSFASSTATTRELPSAERYAVRYIGAVDRMANLRLSPQSPIDPAVREFGPVPMSDEDHTLREVASLEVISPTQSDTTSSSRSPPFFKSK